jgi:hypothetical protein
MRDGFTPLPANSRPSLAARLRARWRRASLDEALSQGVDPTTSEELSLRADQLRSDAVRTQMANRLVAAVGEARGQGQHLRSAKRRQQSDKVRDYADEVLSLVPPLRDGAAVGVQGLAMTARLVNDRKGPLYRAGGQDLRAALRSARSALDGPTTADDVAAAA